MRRVRRRNRYKRTPANHAGLTLNRARFMVALDLNPSPLSHYMMMVHDEVVLTGSHDSVHRMFSDLADSAVREFAACAGQFGVGFTRSQIIATTEVEKAEKAIDWGKQPSFVAFTETELRDAWEGPSLFDRVLRASVERAAIGHAVSNVSVKLESITMEKVTSMLLNLPKLPTMDVIHCDERELKKALDAVLPEIEGLPTSVEDMILPHSLMGVPVHHVPKDSHWCPICQKIVVDHPRNSNRTFLRSNDHER